MSTRFLQCQEIKVKTRDSRPRYHQAIYLRYRSLKRGGCLSSAMLEDRSQVTSFLLRASTVTATVSSQGLINQFPIFGPSHIKTKAVERHNEPVAAAGLTGRASSPLSGPCGGKLLVRSHARASAPTSLPRELWLCCSFMKSSRPVVDPEGTALGRGGRHSESVHSTLLQYTTKLCHVCERARGCSVSNPRTSLVFSHPCSRERKLLRKWVKNTALPPPFRAKSPTCLPSRTSSFRGKSLVLCMAAHSH